MSSSHRRALTRYLAGGLSGIVLFVLAWAVWTASASHTKHTLEAKRYASKYVERSEDRVKDLCTQRTRSALLECAAQEVQRTRDAERAEADLAAQKSMADFAFWALALGIGQVILGVLGYFALIQTLEQNEDTFIHAREATEKQLRAYITVEPGGVNAPSEGKLRAPLDIKNCGATPALRIMVFSKFAVVTDPVNFDPGRGEGLVAEAGDASLGPNTNRFIFPYVLESFVKKHWPDIADRKKALVHFGYVYYNDVFEAGRRTNFAFYYWGDELSDVEAKRCRLGNDAT
jgi:hypothetical protein